MIEDLSALPGLLVRQAEATRPLEAVAVLLVELARQRCEHRDCATAYTVTRGLRQSTTPELRRKLVSAIADPHIEALRYIEKDHAK